ncbi:MAG: PKD domain-containing protein [Burkholderiales bacterium]|nr:MAG: PKD domain-containing protein [Burkholderiales bacterium]
MRPVDRSFALSLPILILLHACGGGGGGTTAPPPVPVLPTSVAVIGPATADVSQPVALSSTAAGTAGITFSWDFGDGSSSTEASPQHSYAQPGDYRVRLTLGRDGATVAGTATVVVNDTARLRGQLCAKADGAGWCLLRATPAATDLVDLAWRSATQGLAVLRNGSLATTQDGGQSWSSYSLGLLLDGEVPSRFIETDANTGWVFTDRHLWQSLDGGQRWTRMTAALEGGASLLFAQPAGRIWAPALGRYSGDGGKTWVARSLPPEERGIFTHSGHFLSSYYTAAGEPAAPLLPDGPLWWWDRGQAKRSSDGGATWTTTAAPTACPTFSVDALPPLQVRGSSLVAHVGARQDVDGTRWAFCVSTDGGASWRAQTASGLPLVTNYTGPKPSLYTPISSEFVRLMPAGGGWVLYGGIFRSTGLDEAWRPVGLPGGYTVYSLLAAPDVNTLMLGATDAQGNGVVLSTADGGVSWRAQGLDNPQVLSNSQVATRVQVLPNQTFAARGTRSFIAPSGQAFTSGDSPSWGGLRVFDKANALALLQPNSVGQFMPATGAAVRLAAWSDSCGAMRHLAPASALRAWGLGDSNDGNRLCVSRDGGATVQVLPGMTLVQPAAGGAYYADVAALDDQRAWVVRVDPATASSAVLATTQAGDAWSPVGVAANLQAAAVKVRDGQRLALLGRVPGTDPSGSCVSTSSDGGQTWARSCFAEEAADLVWQDAQTLWLVGQPLRRSTDAGRTWSTVDIGLGAQDRPLAAQFVTASLGVMVGDRGLILVTRDGGATWQRQARVTGQRLDGVSFIDSKNGWITGDGVVLGTGTGGD